MNVRVVTPVVVAALLALTGCGRSVAKVTGSVTCQGKPVAGSILFSPKGEGADNMGPGVPAQLKADGTYELHLTSLGKHTVVVTPSDVKYPVRPGEADYPCDRSPTVWDVKAGNNEIMIDMKNRSP